MKINRKLILIYKKLQKTYKVNENKSDTSINMSQTGFNSIINHDDFEIDHIIFHRKKPT